MGSRWHVIDEHEMVLLIAEHAEQRRLCATLEGIADALPALPDFDSVARLELQLSAYSQRHFFVESALLARQPGEAKCATADRILQQVRYNHSIDALHADDLAIELRRLCGTIRAAHPGELAYMLRCFFDGCRRAIAFEELALMKLGDARLTPAAKKALVESFQRE